MHIFLVHQRSKLWCQIFDIKFALLRNYPRMFLRNWMIHYLPTTLHWAADRYMSIFGDADERLNLGCDDLLWWGRYLLHSQKRVLFLHKVEDIMNWVLPFKNFWKFGMTKFTIVVNKAMDIFQFFYYFCLHPVFITIDVDTSIWTWTFTWSYQLISFLGGLMTIFADLSWSYPLGCAILHRIKINNRFCWQ